MGIEPTQSAWKAEILPLNYTRKPNQTYADQDIIARKKGFVKRFLEKSFKIFLFFQKKPLDRREMLCYNIMCCGSVCWCSSIGRAADL